MDGRPGYEGAVYAADVALERARNGEFERASEPTRATGERVRDAPFPELVGGIDRAVAAVLETLDEETPEPAAVLRELGRLRDRAEALDVAAREARPRGPRDGHGA